MAVALLDGDLQTAQLEASRIAKTDVQDLLQKVPVRPDDGFTARYPAELPRRVTVRLKSASRSPTKSQTTLGPLLDHSAGRT